MMHIVFEKKEILNSFFVGFFKSQVEDINKRIHFLVHTFII